MIMIRHFLAATALGSAMILAGCNSGADNDAPAPAPETVETEAGAGELPMMARAMLKTADGKDAGMVSATEREDGIQIEVSATGMPAGEHGIHVHMTGTCEGPKFESAGGHWNPTGAKHGLSNPQGQHHGDMPNLVVASDGSAKMDYAIRGARLTEMLDADGAALVIHAKADDQMTDPSGNSGDRLACGAFSRG